MPVTLTAFYGDKPETLAAVVVRAQAILAALGAAFRPYDVRQVHATIVGLEGRADGEGLVRNANYDALRGEERLMQPAALLELVRTSPLLPLRLRIGGYHADAPYPFSSRGQHPYLRSFGVQRERAVLIGWPAEGDRYPRRLDELRREMNRAHVLHKYHAQPGDIDNDLFFVLGLVDTRVAPESAIVAVEDRMRGWLASAPVELRMGPSDLQIVAYRDPTLPPESSVSHPVAQIDAATLASLYLP